MHTTESEMAVAATAAAVRKSVVVGVKRPRSPCHRLHELHVALEQHISDPDMAGRLAEAVLDDGVIVDWPEYWDARRLWAAFAEQSVGLDTSLLSEMLPVLLRSGLRDVLNKPTARAFNVFDETIRANTRAAIVLLKEHHRDAAACPIDFNANCDNGRSSLFWVALLHFDAVADHEWIVYVAQHSDAATLNIIRYGQNPLVFALSGGSAMLAYLRILANPLVSPDDESKLRFLDGAMAIRDVWQDDAKLTPSQYLKRRSGVSFEVHKQAMELIDGAVARQTAHRARVIAATRCALDTRLPVIDLIAIVVSYLPQPP
jgi:hypothetical protein